tara:strand:- start:19559 stop:19756 length:198 start_codon:yes stop_codon:yes gene_type:complete
MSEDRRDEMSDAIDGDHPARSLDYSCYSKAQELVSNRHSKGSLVNLVNHLLLEIERAKEHSDADQ